MSTVNGEGKKPQKDDCFVIMPISDHPDYDKGHFTRVYHHIIKPACEKAKVNPVRGDDVQNTNYIMIDVLKRIIEAPIAICDLSSRNPNVFYELGLRHAFNLPVVLMKDKKTARAFDVQGLRTLDYDASLRVDTVERDTEALAKTLIATMDKKEDVNSIIQLLGIAKADITDKGSISGDTALILDSIRSLGHRIVESEEYRHEQALHISENRGMSLPGGDGVYTGETIFINGELIGNFIGYQKDRGVVVQAKEGELFVVPTDDKRYFSLSTVPF